MLHFKFETKFLHLKTLFCQLKLNCYQQESNFADKKGSTHKHGSLIENYNISATIQWQYHILHTVDISTYLHISTVSTHTLCPGPRPGCVRGRRRGGVFTCCGPGPSVQRGAACGVREQCHGQGRQGLHIAHTHPAFLPCTRRSPTPTLQLGTCRI